MNRKPLFFSTCVVSILSSNRVAPCGLATKSPADHVYMPICSSALQDLQAFCNITWKHGQTHHESRILQHKEMSG